MPMYSWKMREIFDDTIMRDINIRITANNSIDAKKIIMNHIVKITRFGIPRIYITSNGKTVISHSNEIRARNLPFITIDYVLLEKILEIQPNVELNQHASPFIPFIKKQSKH